YRLKHFILKYFAIATFHCEVAISQYDTIIIQRILPLSSGLSVVTMLCKACSSLSTSSCVCSSPKLIRIPPDASPCVAPIANSTLLGLSSLDEQAERVEARIPCCSSI